MIGKTQCGTELQRAVGCCETVPGACVNSPWSSQPKAGYPVSKCERVSRRYHGRALSVLIQSMPAKPGIVI